MSHVFKNVPRWALYAGLISSIILGGCSSNGRYPLSGDAGPSNAVIPTVTRRSNSKWDLPLASNVSAELANAMREHFKLLAAS